MIIIIFFENMVIDAFLSCLFKCSLFNIFLSIVHEYAYFYEYIWKSGRPHYRNQWLQLAERCCVVSDFRQIFSASSVRKVANVKL